MQDALQDLQNEFGEIAASFAVSPGAEVLQSTAIKHVGGVMYIKVKPCRSSLPCLQAETEAFKQTGAGLADMDYQ